jgi:1-deoxy-D-xylulose-5-phosphate reductoisomerase
MRNITVLGSTGTIGVNTLDVIARHPDRFRVVALTAHSGCDRLFEQCVSFAPEFAVCVDERAAQKLKDDLARSGSSTQVLSGSDALIHVASLPQVDYVMAAIVGAAGMAPALAAAESGKRLLLANKEALVMAGALFMRAVEKSGAELIPIDSEHNAIFQSLPAHYATHPGSAGVKRIWLTASGGPFRSLPPGEFSRVTPERACAHPNWAMGRKISVDSATMMNKGLELIEACFLFGVSPEQVEIVVHPQSIVHSLVEYDDGSVIAQLANPDMRIPIAHGLGFPARIRSGAASLDLVKVGMLTFEKPDFKRFPCLGIALRAARRGGTAPAALNAANEVAVNHFLEERIAFTAIPGTRTCHRFRR